MAEPRLAVLVVTWNSAEDLPGCLEAVARLDYRPLELVVVDCGSADDSVAVARGQPMGEVSRQVVALGENRGFAGGMNAALVTTDAPWVLLLNPDARPTRTFASRLLDRAWAHERVGGVTGRLVRPADGSGEGAKPGERLLDACGMWLHPTWRHLDRGSGEADHGQLARAEEVFGATGAASLFARSALDDVAIDGEVFDRDFHSYREDAELCFRLQERGWRVLYEPGAICEHRRRVLPERRARLPAAINYHSLKNRYLLRAYHQTGTNFWRTLLPATSRDLLALGYVLLRERSSLAAYGWLIRHAAAIRRRRKIIQTRRTAAAEAVDRWFRHPALPLEGCSSARTATSRPGDDQSVPGSK